MPATRTKQPPCPAHAWVWCRDGDERAVVIGESGPYRRDPHATCCLHLTTDAATARRWARALAAGNDPAQSDAD